MRATSSNGEGSVVVSPQASRVQLESAVRAAWERRASLRDDPKTDTYRAFHGWSEGVPGLEIDVHGDVATVVCKSAETSLLVAACGLVGELGGFRAVVGRIRGCPGQTLWGSGEEGRVSVQEIGVRYWVEPWHAQHPGLYLDARPARHWLVENASRVRVLNLFSFAGSLGVAARFGGALSVTHVDSQKRALRRCRQNHELNEQRIDARDLVREDVFRWLRQARKRGRRFGGIIVDPPPVREGGADRLLHLVSLAAPLLEPGAFLLLFLHHDRAAVTAESVEEASTRELSPVWSGQSGPDFPEKRASSKLRFLAFRATIGA